MGSILKRLMFRSLWLKRTFIGLRSLLVEKVLRSRGAQMSNNLTSVDVASMESLLRPLRAAELCRQLPSTSSYKEESVGLDIARLGIALAVNKTLLSLKLDTYLNSTEQLVMIEAIRQNQTLESVSVDARVTRMGDETGVALAEAIKQNQTLESFSVDASGTQMGDKTGVALAEAIKQNQTLKSVSVDARYTQMGDETGVALHTKPLYFKRSPSLFDLLSFPSSLTRTTAARGGSHGVECQRLYSSDLSRFGFRSNLRVLSSQCFNSYV
jgi:hypothetical protein